MKGYNEGEIREEDERSDVEYLDEEQAKYVSKNPDWYCSFCNSLNSDNAQFCGNCGASRANSEANYFDMLKKNQEKAAAEQAARPVASAQPQKRSSRPLVIFAVILLAVIGLFVWMNGNKTAGDLKVTALEWTRVIQIDRNREYSESDWMLPDGATLTDTRSELHHFDSVLDHYESREVQRSRQVVDHYETYYTYEDNGNGTFTEVPHERPVYTTEYYTETVQQPVYRQVPNYQTKYYYNIWRWTPKRYAEASGTGHEAAWPELDLAENERAGDRVDTYRITVKDTKDKKQQEVTFRVSEDGWRQLNPGDMVFITFRHNGANPYISNEKGEKLMDLYPDR
jgi:hypothetical protein